MTTTPNLGLTQYAGTDTMNFLTQYNTDLDKIDDYSVATNTNIGTLASLKTAVKTSTVGAINEVYDTTDNGWISARATLTYASASAPTFVCNTSIDLTTRISVGMKIKLTQTTTKYFFVTAITSTTITLYGGTTYSVINATISNVYFSSVQAPYGFPIATAGLGVDFVIENGSNANGSYTKWASGTLICRSGFKTSTTAAGGNIIWTYPTTFFGDSNDKSVVCTRLATNNADSTMAIAVHDNYSVSVYCLSGGVTQVSQSVSYSIIAIGKWK